MKILILDDDINILNSMKRNLRRFNISVFSKPEEAMDAIRQNRFAVALSDMQMPGINGVDFLEHVKNTSPDTIRIMLTGHADLDSTMNAINKANVHQFLTKPFNVENLITVLEKALSDHSETAEKQNKSDEYLHLALHDALTGLPNRAKLISSLEDAIQRSLRYQTVCSLMFIDLNKFKPINDTFGHKVGDEILCEIGNRLNAVLRGTDIVARIGGDEFVILLQDIREQESVMTVAKKVLGRIEEPFQSAEGISCSVSASIGISIFKGSALTPEELIEEADHLMYEAKRTGGTEKIIFRP